LSGLLLALGASLAWGVADFVGPWQGRALGTLRVMLWAQVAGALGVAVAVAVVSSPLPGAQVLFAVPAAFAGTLGLLAYYRGMAIGAMAVVAPIAGAAAVVPVVFGVATGDHPSGVQLAGIVLALAGVTLAAHEHQEGGPRRVATGVGLALLAAAGFGFYFPAMHAAGRADPYWASLIFRAVALLLVAAAALARRSTIRLRGWKLVIVAGVGLGDMLGNFFFSASAHTGGLVSVTSVLASLYPIVTVILAAVVLGERVARAQRAGVVLTLAGVALISA
jgi:drug/metabolite transporter (DMT)-like permease